MTPGHFIDRLQTGLWRENPGLVQLLGLCPLLAVTTTFVNGLGLGVATLVVLTCSNVLVSATRRWILAEIRVPIYVLIIASLVTCTELIVSRAHQRRLRRHPSETARRARPLSPAMARASSLLKLRK